MAFSIEIFPTRITLLVWSRCLANADRGKEAISARDRTLYENAEALDRRIPLPVLTMSLSR